MARILIVDDETSILTVLRVLAAGMGHEVVTCSDGAEGIKAMESDQSFDLVITDLRMHGINGMQVIASAKKNCPEAPVIVVSAYLSDDKWEQAKRLGAVGGLVKPFRAEQVRDIINANIPGNASAKP